MPDHLVTLLSRWQFAATAMFHFLFVPLTIGLALILAIMETVYVMIDKVIWKQMTKFWGLLFGINFAMGVATGITMEFQFGMNWSYFSQFVGDVFGAPLAIEGLMAFFLEATFVGLFFFGWERLPKLGHWLVTCLLALGTNLSALWILIANGWMQNPVGAVFDYHTMRMEITNFFAIVFNPVAQAKFVHTVSAAYVTASMFVLSISAYYLLRKRNTEFAKRSMAVAAAFGLCSALSVVVLGDESGYLANQHQRMKLATMESMWHTEKPPASFTVFGWPDSVNHTTKYAIKVPYVLGIIATRSLTEPLPGIVNLVNRAKEFMVDGGIAYDALKILQQNPEDAQAKILFQQYQKYLGYGFILARFSKNPTQATPQEIDAAAWSTVPARIPTLFWAFRIMVACGFYFIALFILAFYLSSKRQLNRPWFLRLCLWSLPLPWIAAELGWFVAEHGRQPWLVEGMLPTSFGASLLSPTSVWISLIGFVLFYGALFTVALYLMIKTIRLGPEGFFKHWGEQAYA